MFFLPFQAQADSTTKSLFPACKADKIDYPLVRYCTPYADSNYNYFPFSYCAGVIAYTAIQSRVSLFVATSRHRRIFGLDQRFFMAPGNASRTHSPFLAAGDTLYRFSCFSR